MYFCSRIKSPSVPQVGEEVAHGEISFWYKIGIRESRGAYTCSRDHDFQVRGSERETITAEKETKNGFSLITYKHLIYILIFIIIMYIYFFFLFSFHLPTAVVFRCTLWSGYKINALMEYLISVTPFAVGRRRSELQLPPSRRRVYSVTINNDCKAWCHNVQILDLHTNRTRPFSRWKTSGEGDVRITDYESYTPDAKV